MESVGEKLRQTRESRGYTVEQIARDTHIAKRFLEALEAEEFDVFPGDPYLLGFMRTYSEYLGLDSEEVVSLYRNLKLQEQPAPIDELISRSPSRSPWRRVLLIAVGVAVLGGGTYLLVSGGVFARQESATVSEEPGPQGAVFQLTGEWVEQRFAEGDRIIVEVGEQSYSMDLTAVGERLDITTPRGVQPVEVGGETALDLNADGVPDVRIVLRSIDTVDSPPTVVMRVSRGAAQESSAGGAAASGSVGDQAAVDSGTLAIGSTSEPSRVQQAVVIAEFDQREDFFVEIRFEGYTLFRYELDDEPRVEQYFQQGQTLRASVHDRFQLWVSNAGVARLRVAGHDLELGSAGQVTAALITWAGVPDSSTVRLELIPVY